MEFKEKLDCCFGTDSSLSLHTLICGHSIFDISSENQLASNNLLHILKSNGFDVSKWSATRATNKSATWIDHVFPQNISKPYFSVLEQQKFADRYLVTTRWFGKNSKNINYNNLNKSFFQNLVSTYAIQIQSKKSYEQEQITHIRVRWCRCNH